MSPPARAAATTLSDAPHQPPFPACRYGAVVRADQSAITIGGRTSIGDRTVIASSAVNPTGFAARTAIGDWVTIGESCVLRGCSIDNYAVVGEGCIIQEGALIESNAILEPGSVLPSGARVPSGEVYAGNPAAFVRKLEKDEITAIETKADEMFQLSRKHADEFLSYSTNYQLREQMGK